MVIITRSESSGLAATAVSYPARSNIKPNNTKNRSRAKLRSRAFRSISPSSINLLHVPPKSSTK